MTKKVKSIVPDMSFKKESPISQVMIQFDDDKPRPVIDMLDDKSKVTFELSNTQFSSLEFTDDKTNKKFKIFINKKDGN